MPACFALSASRTPSCPKPRGPLPTCYPRRDRQAEYDRLEAKYGPRNPSTNGAEQDNAAAARPRPGSLVPRYTNKENTMTTTQKTDAIAPRDLEAELADLEYGAGASSRNSPAYAPSRRTTLPKSHVSTPALADLADYQAHLPAMPTPPRPSGQEGRHRRRVGARLALEERGRLQPELGATPKLIEANAEASTALRAELQ